LIAEIKQFLGLPHCQHAAVSLKNFHHLTKRTDISEDDVRNVCRGVLSPDTRIYKTQQGTHCDTMEQ
jgi:hypothetical protein